MTESANWLRYQTRRGRVPVVIISVHDFPLSTGEYHKVIVLEDMFPDKSPEGGHFFTCFPVIGLADFGRKFPSNTFSYSEGTKQSHL